MVNEEEIAALQIKWLSIFYCAMDCLFVHEFHISFKALINDVENKFKSNNFDLTSLPLSSCRIIANPSTSKAKSEALLT